jgi:hypothetical protein
MSKTLEELGYEKIEDRYGNIVFDKSDKTIVFFEKTKTFSCVSEYNRVLEDLTMEELKAIYKYCEDNKWI